MVNYQQSSMTDIAFDLISKTTKPVDFFSLWEEVATIKQYDEAQKAEKESLFYTNLTLDGRIINVGENKWDLRDRHEFKEVHPDMNDYYTEEDEEDEYEEEVDDSTEEDDYN